MATEMFGGSPDELRQALLNQRAAQFAAQTPQQQLGALAYKGGAGIGQALGGLFGVDVTDPEMRRLQQRQEMLKGVDLTDPASLKQGVEAAMKSNDTKLATELLTRYQAATKAALEGRKTEAEIGAKLSEKSTTEMKNAAALAASSGAEIGTPAWTTAYNKNLERLTTAAGKGDTIKEVGVAAKTGEAVYTYQTPAGVQQVVFAKDPTTGKQVMVPYNGPVDRTTAKTDVGVKLPAGESEFVKKLGELDAKTVNEAMVASRNARSTLGALEKLTTLNNEQLISGSFAAGRVGATNLLNSLGLTSQADAARLATSENYQKVAGDVILQTLGGKLGAGFSNEDRKFIEGLIPQLENSPQARRQLIKFMAEKNRDIVAEATRLEDYARENKGLKGFKPKIPFAEAPASPYSGLSDAELAARIRAAQAQQQR